MFIYRGKEYEWLEDFSLKLLSQFPNAVRMTSTAPPGDNISNSSGQCILISYATKAICFVLVFYHVSSVAAGCRSVRYFE